LKVNRKRTYFGTRKNSIDKQYDIVSNYVTTTNKRADWRQNYVEFKRNTMLSSPHKGSCLSHYLSHDFKVNSTKNSIIIQNGDTKTFISSMSRDKFDKSKGRNDLEVSTVQSGKIGSVSFKLHKPKKVKKLIKHSTSFMKRQ